MSPDAVAFKELRSELILLARWSVRFNPSAETVGPDSPGAFVAEKQEFTDVEVKPLHLCAGIVAHSLWTTAAALAALKGSPLHAACFSSFHNRGVSALCLGSSSHQRTRGVGLRSNFSTLGSTFRTSEGSRSRFKMWDLRTLWQGPMREREQECQSKASEPQSNQLFWLVFAQFLNYVKCGLAKFKNTHRSEGLTSWCLCFSLATVYQIFITHITMTRWRGLLGMDAKPLFACTKQKPFHFHGGYDTERSEQLAQKTGQTIVLHFTLQSSFVWTQQGRQQHRPAFHWRSGKEKKEDECIG